MRSLAHRLRRLETHKLEQTVIVVHGMYSEDDDSGADTSWRVFTENTREGVLLQKPQDMSLDTFIAEIKHSVMDTLLVFTPGNAEIFNPSNDYLDDNT